MTPPPDTLPPPSAVADDHAVLAEFLARLVERVSDALPAAGQRGDHERRLAGLELAEAALRLAGSRRGRPLQIAVVGPTQTGKSTVVNLLLGENRAGVSPLAGYTVHAQGFAIGADEGDAWLASAFPKFDRVSPGGLSRDDLGAYSIQAVGEANGRIAPCVLWDTPDFDSLASAEYRRAVLECAALADVLVLVVSKEKYADLSVWEFLELVAPLQTPLVVVLNKMTEDAGATIIAAVEDRLDRLRPAPSVRVVGLPWSAVLRATGDGMDRAAVQRLRDAIGAAGAATQKDECNPSAGAVRLVRRGWSEWTAPLVAERHVRLEWEELVSREVDAAVAGYSRDFLEHPQRYDTFRRATLELLRMLELPIVGTALGRARELVSGVARSAWSFGRRVLARSAGAERPEPPSAERLVLENLVDRCLFGVARDALRRCRESEEGAAAWQALSERLEHDESLLREQFLARAADAQAAFAPEIRATADHLLSVLKERRALLNTLRAARATTDVASIALAIKTGGSPVHDLLLAPAMFAFTSILTEGALGQYMGGVARDLRKRQLDHMRRAFFDQPVGTDLAALSRRLEGPRLYGALTDDLAAAAAALDRLEAAEAAA
ncbi:MAG: GTPase domain-containing protein [Phycisphaerales bacterium]|nr:GTPase domain-containing protein [Phycisphaerales bacterium]